MPQTSQTTPAATADERTVQTSRWLAHPPASIYAAFASAGQLAQWWGPSGFRNTFERFEFCDGGRWDFVMHAPDGSNYPNSSVFLELVADRKVVVRHDCAPHFTLSISLAPADGGTLLQWQQVVDEAAVAAAMRPMATAANEQNLDRLAQLLAAH